MGHYWKKKWDEEEQKYIYYAVYDDRTIFTPIIAFIKFLFKTFLVNPFRYSKYLINKGVEIYSKRKQEEFKLDESKELIFRILLGILLIPINFFAIMYTVSFVLFILVKYIIPYIF